MGEHLTRGCVDDELHPCPFYCRDGRGDWCYCGNMRRDLPSLIEGPTPPWCPLRAGPVTVELEGAAPHMTVERLATIEALWDHGAACDDPQWDDVAREMHAELKRRMGVPA